MSKLRTRTFRCKAVEGLTQGQSHQDVQGLKLRCLLQPLIFPHAKAASFSIIDAIKKGRGRGEEGGGERRREERRGEEGSPPQPAAGSFLARGRASNEGPTMPLSWRCQPGSPAELRAAHLCPQLAHRSSIKARACCQRQRPQGRPCL
jgi:hypothetical protein